MQCTDLLADNIQIFPIRNTVERLFTITDSRSRSQESSGAVRTLQRDGLVTCRDNDRILFTIHVDPG